MSKKKKKKLKLSPAREAFLEEYERVLDKITEHGLDANLSVKPTAFGILIDENQASVNLERLLRKAAEQDIFIRLDMEDRRVTQATLDICLRMHELGLTNVGVVLQARLLRTPDDITAFAEKLGPAADYRICKGIYLEPAEVAHTGYREIVNAMNDCVELMLDSGAYVGIASHLCVPLFLSPIQVLVLRIDCRENHKR